jgi:thioredoxin-like negative regulator of GroEL
MTLADIMRRINTGEPVLIYFSGQNCSVCHDLKPKIFDAIQKHYPKIELFEVQTHAYKEIASHFTVFSVPTILLFLDKKECVRVGRNISVSAFIQQIQRPYSLFCNEE